MLPEFGRHDCRILAEFLAVFGNATRLQMLCALQSGRKTVGELAEYAEVSMPSASQHLRVMREKGAVSTTREGQRVYYEVVDPRIIEGASLMRSALVDLTRRNAELVNGSVDEVAQ